jgi:AraC-like DNA-binding protein
MLRRPAPPYRRRGMESRHSYSVRLMKPFARLLRTYASMPPEVVAPIEDFETEARLPIETVHELLRGAILITGDEDIGLKAAQLIEIGDYGALEYAASTAQNGREAFLLVGRYMRLINDALTLSIRTEGERAVISLESAVVMPRAAEDFEVAAFFVVAMGWVPSALPTTFEVRFQHARPADTQHYARVFSDRATICFDQPVAGFSFPNSTLSSPLPSADPKLHALIRQHADNLLAELPQADSVTARVRVLLTQGFASGKSSADYVASSLHVSPSTLTRKLEREGTNFKTLHDEMRRSLALRYVGQSDLTLSEIAFLLGFSQSAAFHRAFKRWTEQTPLEYRTARRG